MATSTTMQQWERSTDRALRLSDFPSRDAPTPTPLSSVCAEYCSADARGVVPRCACAVIHMDTNTRYTASFISLFSLLLYRARNRQKPPNRSVQFTFHSRRHRILLIPSGLSCSTMADQEPQWWFSASLHG